MIKQEANSIVEIAELRQVFDVKSKVLALGFVIMLCVSQSGCQVFRSFRSQPEPLPVVFQEAPSQMQLIQVLNDRVRKVEQLQSNVSLEAEGMPKLKGTLQIERPDRLRLKAGLMGVTELGVDVGSNSDLFWVWTRAALPGQSPAIYFARHHELRQSVNRSSLPIEPQWIFDAIGLAEFRSTDVIQGPFAGPGKLVTILATRQTPAGPVTRRTVLDPQTASIYQQAVYDSKNRLICYSNSMKYKRYDQHQVSLPQRIEIVVIDQNQNPNKLVVEANEYKINALYGDPDKMWSMPAADGVPRVNMAATSPSGIGSY